MIRSLGVQSESGRRWVIRLALLVLLAVALGSWWWVLEQTLANEREAVAAQIERERVEQFQRALTVVGGGMEGYRETVLKQLGEERSLILVSEYLSLGMVSGVLFEEPEEFEVVREGVWLSDAEGRDEASVAMLERVEEEEVWEVFRERLLGKEGPEMKASFRSWVIGEALMRRGEEDELLESLARSEEVRALGEVPEGSLWDEKDGVTVWWGPDFVREWFEKEGVAVEVGESGRILPSLSGRGDLRVSLMEGDDLFRNSGKVIRWVGMGSGLLFLAIASGALWVGWREMKLAKMRTDLAASVAHELRTPLAGQRVLLESLGGGLEQTEEERVEYVEMALRSNRKLSGLVGQFLTFSRLQRGVLQLEGERVDLKELVEEVMGDWREKFAEVNVDVEEGLVMTVDREAVGTILRNLVENAWKYSGAGEKKMVLGMERRGTRLFFAVGDNGKGLSESERRKVFRKFWRADDKLTRKTEGLGLGLSIVKSLAQAHGGDVVVKKAALGGASFAVFLEEL
ncbi:MAG: HAMP domain-containing sensor histidine kinase [Verrucomicrobiota bacterium]